MVLRDGYTLHALPPKSVTVSFGLIRGGTEGFGSMWYCEFRQVPVGTEWDRKKETEREIIEFNLYLLYSFL